MNVIDCSTNMKEIEIYYKEDIYVFLLVKGSVNIVTKEVVLTILQYQVAFQKKCTGNFLLFTYHTYLVRF